jgi:hypothetical protein
VRLSHGGWKSGAFDAGFARSDPAILAELLALHAVGDRVLDASWGYGRIWSTSLVRRYRLTRLDLRPETQPDVVSNWNELDGLFAARTFDVVVWDPPHITDAGRGLVGAADWADRYGTRSPGFRAINICHTFAPVLRAARSVLDPHVGTLIVKPGDQVHAGQLQPFELRNIALELGWLACDYQVRLRTQPSDPKWKV